MVVCSVCTQTRNCALQRQHNSGRGMFFRQTECEVAIRTQKCLQSAPKGKFSWVQCSLGIGGIGHPCLRRCLMHRAALHPSIVLLPRLFIGRYPVAEVQSQEKFRHLHFFSLWVHYVQDRSPVRDLSTSAAGSLQSQVRHAVVGGGKWNPLHFLDGIHSNSRERFCSSI